MGKPIVRLLLMDYSWILLCLLLVTVNGATEKCGQLTKTLVLENDPNVCDKSSGPVLGNSGQFVTLDFSKADNTVLNAFLKQFDTIQAAIIIDQSNLETVNFGKIGTWNGARVPLNDAFISIRNNPKLTKFEWDTSEVTEFQVTASQKTTYVFIYNNPLLDAVSLEKLTNAISKSNNIKKFIQSKPSECWFEDPLDNKKYIDPSPEILENCRIIKGDLILKTGTLKENLTLSEGACLKLAGVDMDGVKITASKGQGKVTCKDGTTSEVKGNLNLCGSELQKLAEYFPAGSTVQIEMDPGTCTIECTNHIELNSPYNYCSTTTMTGTITDWFTAENLKGKVDHLVSSEGLTISHGSMTKINFPKLTYAKGLTIRDNEQLTDLDLPELKNVEHLIIERNPQLSFSKIKQALANIRPTTSTVECRTTSTDVVKDIEDLRLCSTIIGPLILNGLAKDVDPANFNLKKVNGCISIVDTRLKSLAFLNVDIVGCTEKHSVTGKNPKLCKVGYLDRNKKAPITFSGDYNTYCGKVCNTSAADNCEVFDGPLAFTSTQQHAAQKLKTLKFIQGRLTIDKSPAERIDLPNLEQIEAATAPALQITDNLALKNLTMGKLKKITVCDGKKPIIKITGNKKLKKETLKQFLPPNLYDECIKKTANCEYVDSVVDDGGGGGGNSNKTLVIAVVVAGALLALLIGAGVGGFFLYKHWKKKKEAQKQKEMQANNDDDDDDDDDEYDCDMVDEKRRGGKLWKSRKREECFYYKILGVNKSKRNQLDRPHCEIFNLPVRAVKTLHQIVQPLGVEGLMFWRCQFVGITYRHDAKGYQKDSMALAMINQKMLLNKNVHLINGNYLDQWPPLLQALTDKIEVIPVDNSRMSGGGDDQNLSGEGDINDIVAGEINGKGAAAGENKKPSVQKNYKPVHIIHIGTGFAKFIKRIRKRNPKKKKISSSVASLVKKITEENMMKERKEKQMRRKKSGRNNKSKDTTSMTGTDTVNNTAAVNSQRSSVDNLTTDNQTKSGEGPKKEEEVKKEKPKIKFVQHNRVDLVDEDAYRLIELTGALIFTKKNGKRHRMEVVVLEVIPLSANKKNLRKKFQNRMKKKLRKNSKALYLPKARKNLFYSMKCASLIPWPAIVKYALENNIIIHTEQADYYLLIYYFISTWEALSGVYGPPDMDHFYHFGHGIYRRYVHRLYTDQFNSGAANAWYIWAATMCRWYLSLEKKFGGREGTKKAKIFKQTDDKVYASLERIAGTSSSGIDELIITESSIMNRKEDDFFRWAELHGEKTSPEHPLYAFFEKLESFGLPDKKFEYDSLELWPGLKVEENVMEENAKLTKIIGATKTLYIDSDKLVLANNTDIKITIEENKKQSKPTFVTL